MVLLQSDFSVIIVKFPQEKVLFVEVFQNNVAIVAVL